MVCIVVLVVAYYVRTTYCSLMSSYWSISSMRIVHDVCIDVDLLLACTCTQHMYRYKLAYGSTKQFQVCSNKVDEK